MSRRLTIGIPAFLVLASLLALGAVPLAWGSGAAQQADPTQQQQTIDAIVQARFTQTAAVQQQLDMTQTAEAATLFTPTLTAAFEATVEAAFNQALTATAAPQATATAEAFAQTMPGVLVALEAIADGRGEAITRWLGENQVALEVMLAANPLAGLDREALADLLESLLASQNRFSALFVYDISGAVLAATDPALGGAQVASQPYFRASLSGPLTQPPVLDAASGALVMIVTRPIFDGSGQTVGVLAGEVNLATLDDLFAEPTAYEQQIATYLQVEVGASSYLVAGANRTVLAPADLAAASRVDSSGITRALAGESGVTPYNDWRGQAVAGAFRWVPALNAALIVEVPMELAIQLGGVLPTPTPTPTITPTPLPASATPRPEIFPTNTVAQVQIAEQVFEHGRMFWIRHTRQIWVMVNVPQDDSTGGDWFCYNDTFEEGEAEIDPSLVPPEGMYQPRRGFGKLWRTHQELKNTLGWALTPEFELTSNYTYIAGGYVQGMQYFPGPGEHRLTTLYNESISFFEADMRGDCLGGTWHMTTAAP
jgi:hypothetical protein